jgi:hypothetical protein
MKLGEKEKIHCCDNQEIAEDYQSVTFKSDTATHTSTRCVYIDLKWCVNCKAILNTSIRGL